MTKQDKADLLAIFNLMNSICFRRDKPDECKGCPFHNKALYACNMGNLISHMKLLGIDILNLYKEAQNADGQTN